MTLKNINFSENPQNIELQNFEPMKISEYPHPPPLWGGGGGGGGWRFDHFEYLCKARYTIHTLHYSPHYKNRLMIRQSK